MVGNGKHASWKTPFHRNTPSSSNQNSSGGKPQPPEEFVCQVSGLLMADPVIVTSGQTFERVSVQVCRDFNYLPLLTDGSRPDFSNLIPNMAIRNTIHHWCDSNGLLRPISPDYRSIESIVDAAMAPNYSLGFGNMRSESSLFRGVAENPSPVRLDHAVMAPNYSLGFGNMRSESSLLRGVAENPPPVRLDHADTEIMPRRRNPFNSSSSEELFNMATPLPLATRPACYSIGSSSDLYGHEDNLYDVNPSSPEEEDFLSELLSDDVIEQEESVISLRNLTKWNQRARVSICTPVLLSSLKSLIVSRNSVIQTNAMAALVNLSLEKVNKMKIVGSGMVPPLIGVLKGGLPESQEHAAGAIFSLSLEDDNKTAIGVLGGLQPLMHSLKSESSRTRHDSALALYHLSLVQSNRVKLVKLGAVPLLLNMLNSNDMASRCVLVLCNLAACNEGKSAMLDGNAVESLVGMLRKASKEADSDATSENVVAALYSMSHGSLRFKGLAKDAGAVELLRRVEERGSERAREKAKKMLQMMRGRDETHGDDSDAFDDNHRRQATDSSGYVRPRYRNGYASTTESNLYSVNSTDF